MGLSHSRQRPQDTDPCLPFPFLLPNDSILNNLQVFWGMGWFYVCCCNRHRRAQILINTGALGVRFPPLAWGLSDRNCYLFFSVESLVAAFLIVHLPGQYKNEKRLCFFFPVQGIHKLPFPPPTARHHPQRGEHCNHPISHL